MLDYLAAAHGAEHAEATAFGLSAGSYVALAMIVVFAIALYVRAPALVAKILDNRIEGIRKQLDEAAQLRREAEALRDDYANKAAAAEQDIAALRTRAEKDAADIVEKAKADAASLIERHKALSADRIATAERDAVAELRAKAASAATIAARELIAQRHGEAADRALADRIIADI
ncbi:MAG: F0F1 ATP synthase subunit B family protein [Tsuneonella sp.]